MTVTQTRRSATATEAKRTKPEGRHNGGREFTLDLPFLTVQLRSPDVRMPSVHLPDMKLPEMHMPEMHMPDMRMPRVNRQEVGHAVDVARSFLPPPERIVYYGGLGALAVFGLLEWPVAAAIGAGTLIAQRARSGERGKETARGRNERKPEAVTPAAKAPRAKATGAKAAGAKAPGTKVSGTRAARTKASEPKPGGGTTTRRTRTAK
ncbi:hypothetical protein [Microtetraspora sp. NBRC 13810]|uniref:hypothetical protein n=1 Tax=Microtetraspora sp. NBRC 13810 TaxID=3030990 RepID=UPI002555CBBC|nr:hypothetical protein [Microtetraspora sp. NBRC 13810]